MPASSDPTDAWDLGQAVPAPRLGALPTTEQRTDPPGREGECVADVLERERPAHVRQFEPVCRPTKETLAANSWRAGASAERPDRVLEYRGHEPELGRPFGGPLQELGELHGQYLLRNKLARIIRLFVAQLHGRMSEQLECQRNGYRSVVPLYRSPRLCGGGERPVVTAAETPARRRCAGVSRLAAACLRAPRTRRRAESAPNIPARCGIAIALRGNRGRLARRFGDRAVERNAR